MTVWNSPSVERTASSPPSDSSRQRRRERRGDDVDVTDLPSPGERGAAIRAVYAGRFTQVELASRLGVAQNTVSRWSTGDIEPSLDDIARIEAACGVPRGTILRNAGYVAGSETIEELIFRDPSLSADQRSLVLAAYRTARRRPSH